MLQTSRGHKDLLAEHVTLKAEICRRQAQVLGHKHFMRGFAEAFVARNGGEKPTHSKDLKRKYVRT